MIIRSATDADIPAIIELLKLSLGESLMPKSEAYWNWKHVNNPFGKSPVLLAEENNQIIGVRAFMQWSWSRQDKVYLSLRAVDTAVHPDYQGKGIFKKLTMSLIEQCTEEEFDFIYNTPNPQSKPGYLKMGWQVLGKLPVTIRFPALQRIIFGSKPQEFKEGYNLQPIIENPHFEKLIQSQSNQGIHTALSVNYFKWRYLEVPVVKYYGEAQMKEGVNWIVIFRIKPFRKSFELRIVELLFDSVQNLPAIKQAISKLNKELKPAFISIGGQSLSRKELKALGFSFNLKIGPIMTFRSLGKEVDDFGMDLKQWGMGLGDMELF